MNDPFKREIRYTVFKNSDGAAALSKRERDVLCRYLDKITEARRLRGKPPMQAVIVEHDWPEYEPVWAMIESRMGAAAEIGRAAMKDE